MRPLDIFSLEGRVALIPGGGRRHRVGPGGGLGRRGCSGRGRGSDALRPATPPSNGSRRPAPRASRSQPTSRARPTATAWSGRRSSGSARSTSSSTRSVAARGRSSIRPRRTRAIAWDWIMELNVRSTIVPTQAVARAMIERGQRRTHPEHLVGAGEPRDQRRLLGLCRGQGRDQLADAPVGDRVGEVRHPGQRDHADLRRHAPGRHAARGPGVQGGHRQPDPARVGSARPDDLVGPAIFFCSDAASFVTGQVLGIDGGLTATQ